MLQVKQDQRRRFASLTLTIFVLALLSAVFASDAKAYSLTLVNGKEDGQNSAVLNCERLPQRVEIPVWKHYIFKGYFTEDGVPYYNEHGERVGNRESDDTLTLFAQWENSASIDSLSLLLDGEVGLRFHTTINDPSLNNGYMVMSLGSRQKTVAYKDAPRDLNGRAVFSFEVNAIQMAEKVSAKFYDAEGNECVSEEYSVEDYYNLIKENSSVGTDEKQTVKALVNYGYYAQQALLKDNLSNTGATYAASTKQGGLSTSVDELAAYMPVVTGSSDRVTDISLSLLLDNKTSLCLYFTTNDSEAPDVEADCSYKLKEVSDRRWALYIPNIDVLSLSTIHTLTVDGLTIRLSALSYGNVCSGTDNVNAIRALHDYYQAALKLTDRVQITSATVEQAAYEYTGEPVKPVLTVKAGSTTLTGDDYTVEWDGNLTDAGIYTGLVTGTDYNGGATVTIAIEPKETAIPTAVSNLVYNGETQIGVNLNGGKIIKEKGTDSVVVSTDDESSSAYTLSGSYSAADAGDYTSVATLLNANYRWKDGTNAPILIEWRIDPQTVPAPQADTTVFSYDGEPKTVIAADETAPYTVTGCTASEAGNYTAAAVLQDKLNYRWDNGSTDDVIIRWQIIDGSRTVAIPVPNTTVFEYDGMIKTVLSVDENAPYTVEGNTGADVGQYTAVLTLKDPDSFCWENDGSSSPKYIEWRITTQSANDIQEATLIIENTEPDSDDVNEETDEILLIGEEEELMLEEELIDIELADATIETAIVDCEE